MGLLRDLGLWLWRLLPANPILVRVVSMGGKRVRHLWARLIYLIVLFVVMLLMGGGLLVPHSTSLAELAKNSTNTFMWVSLVQLFLMSFIAPIFTAGAITQEKDANTFHILLTTPLSNAQIVLGSLMSRLYFVLVMLLSGLPIFCITMIYGGVTLAEVFYSFALAACTALLTGALAIMISMLKVGTRRTIFSFFLGVAVYMLGIWAIGLSSFGQLAEAPLGTGLLGTTAQYRMSWLAPIHPFLAFFAVTGQTPVPSLADVWHYGWPARWLLTYPQYGYIVLTTLASGVMVLISLIFVRRGAKEGEATLGSKIRAAFVQQATGELRRRPRRVWKNPIAWREANTRASAGGRSMLRWLFLIAGGVGAIVLLMAYEQNWWAIGNARMRAEEARMWLTVVIWIELAVILLVVTNTAATTLTREKESQTIELLLASPLTSRYIIAGMLQGLVRFVLPLIGVPAFTLLIFVFADLIRRSGTPAVTTPEALLLAPLLMIAFAALAAMIGLQFSLVSKKTIQAVMISTAIVLGASGLLWACGFAMRAASEMVVAVILPFSPFPAVQSLVDVETLFAGGHTPSAATIASVRVVRCMSSLVSAVVYLAITYSLYKNMVRSFDMTVRRQSA